MRWSSCLRRLDSADAHDSQRRRTSEQSPPVLRTAATSAASGGLAEAVTGGDPLEIPLVEELDAHLGIELAQPAQLPVLPGDERLLHDRDLEIEVLVGEVEIGRERLDDLALLIALEHERVRLVHPRHAVVIEDLGVLEFRLVDEAWRLFAAICLEMGRFERHLQPRYQRRRMTTRALF